MFFGHFLKMVVWWGIVQSFPQWYISSNADDVDSALASREACIEEIIAWMGRNNLKLNTSKTEFMIWGSKSQY